MSGYRTIIACAIAALASLLQLVGVDLGAELAAHGLTAEGLADSLAGGLNAAVALAAALAGIWYRIRARKALGGTRQGGPAQLSLHPAALMAACMVGVLAAAALSGCGAQLSRAPDARDRLAIAYGTHATVTESAALLLDARRISLETAKHIRAEAATAKAGLDLAKSLLAGGEATGAEALRRIQAAQTVLDELRKKLARHDNADPQGP